MIAAALLAWACQQDPVSREEFEKMKKEMETLRRMLETRKDLTPREREEFERMKKELEELKKKMGQPSQDEKGRTLPEKSEEEAKRKAGTVYAKPFLARFGRGVYLGGYIDLEFFNTQKSDGKTFDQHRLVPFLYADVSENIKVAAEIEIEHGGELAVEFAHLDYWLFDWLNFRAGIILDPIGKFNLQHDAPYQDLTDRPLVDQFVIPVVLREPGLGLFGSIDIDPVKIEYEAYVTNGFKGLSKSGTNKITTSKGLRDARILPGTLGSLGRDFNDNKSFVGRLSVSPFLGVEAGASTHIGRYDERGDNLLSIVAFDWTLDFGGIWNRFFGGDGVLRDIFFALEVVGEWALADIERDDFAREKGVPNDFRGFYIEGRYHFFFDFLRKIIPGANDETTFTAVVRWDYVDLASEVRKRITLGLNFRLREDTVFKFEYQFNREAGDLDEAEDDGFVFSVATYF